MAIPRIPHPGRFLAGELKERGRTQKYFAELIEKTTEEVNYLLNGKRAITLDWAIRIGKALGTSYEPRLHMQNKRDAILIMQDEKKSKLLMRIGERVALQPSIA